MCVLFLLQTCSLHLVGGNSPRPSPPLEKHPCPLPPSAWKIWSQFQAHFLHKQFIKGKTTCPGRLPPPASVSKHPDLPLRPPFLLFAENRRVWWFIWNFTTSKSVPWTIYNNLRSSVFNITAVYIWTIMNNGSMKKRFRAILPTIPPCLYQLRSWSKTQICVKKCNLWAFS